MPLPGTAMPFEISNRIAPPTPLFHIICRDGYRNAVLSPPFLPSAPTWHFAKAIVSFAFVAMIIGPTLAATFFQSRRFRKKRKREASNSSLFRAPIFIRLQSLSLPLRSFSQVKKGKGCVPSPPSPSSFPPLSYSCPPSPAPSPGYRGHPPAHPSSPSPSSNALKSAAQTPTRVITAGV